jgi:thymidylate synthase
MLNARGCNFLPGKLYISFGDIHLYESHIEPIKNQLNNIPFLFPKLNIKKNITDIKNVSYEDFEIIDYVSYSKINMEMIA